MKSLRFLFILYMLLPFSLLKKMSVLGIEPTPYAVTFGTIFPHLTILDVAIIFSLILALIFRKFRAPHGGIIWNLYIILNLFSFVIILVAIWVGDRVYFDGILEFIRLSLVFYLFLFAVSNYNPETLLFTSLSLLMLFYLIVFFSGYIVSPYEAGRLNAPGLEVSSTGYVSGCLLIMSIISGNKKSLWGRAAAMVFGFCGLLLSGSILAFAITMLVMLLIIARKVLRNREIRYLVAVILLFIVFLFVMYRTERLPTVVKIIRLIDARSMPASFSGRLDAISAGIYLMERHPFGLINSDWYVQEKLVAVGYPSHTHNSFIQFYLKYGPSVVLFFALLIGQTVNGLRKGSPYSYPLLLFLLGWALDYPLFVTKYALVVFAIAGLNERFLKTSATIKEDSCKDANSSC